MIPPTAKAHDPLAGFATFSEAAKIIGKAEYTLAKYIRQGRIPKYKIGQTTYLKLADLVPQPVPVPKHRA